jgi:serine/threonine protein phosphatase PrpC
MNEDVHIVRADQGLFVVCDGMGGAAAGEVASRMAAETIASHLNGRPLSHVDEESGPGFLPHTARLVDAVRRSNELVHHQALHNPQQADMGTTAVTVLIDQQIASVAHVGDSRAYLWYEDQLVRLTCDHLLAGSENVLLRALGREPDVDVAISEVPLQPGDFLLLCTDGLTRMVADAGLCDAIRQLRDPQRICDCLVETANQRGGADNITVIVIEVVGNWWQRMSNSWRRDAGGAHDVAFNRQM